MAKGKVPTRDELLAFIRDSETPVGKREIARAYGLKGDQRIELKELLRDLRDAGEITPDRAKTFRHPESLSDMVVLEIVSVDGDGHLLAVPRRHDDDKDGPPPRIEVSAPASRTVPAPAVGDRVRASMKRRGKDTYEAKVVRRLGSGPKKILGLYEEPPGRNGLGLVTPTDRKLRREFDVRPTDRNGALPGDIVWIEETGGALARRARIVERIGPMSDPRTVSLISIATNDIPVDFPEAAIEEADKAKAAPTARTPATSTTPCSPSPIPTIPAAGTSSSPSPTSPGTCATTGRSTALPIAAAPRSTSRIASCRCCRSSFPTTGARWCRTRIARCWWPRCGSTPRAISSATSSTAP